MYPFISLPFFDIRIYTFGLFLVLSFGAFYYMIIKACKKSGLNPNFFISNILSFVVGTFVVSRLTFVALGWMDFQYQVQDKFWNIFIMNDYNLSFAGGVIGFLGVLVYKLKKHQQPIEKYLDVVILAFLFSAILGYIGAFLGGQIYGQPTSLSIGVIYKSDSSNIPYTSAVLPLSILYSLACFSLFSLLYIFKEVQKIPGMGGFFGLAIISIVLFVGEFFSGNDDILRDSIYLNATQILTLFTLGYTGIWIGKQIRIQV